MYVDKSQRNCVNIIIARVNGRSGTSENDHIPLFLPLLHCILYDYIIDLTLLRLLIRSDSVLRDISICGKKGLAH